MDYRYTDIALIDAAANGVLVLVLVIGCAVGFSMLRRSRAARRRRRRGYRLDPPKRRPFDAGGESIAGRVFAAQMRGAEPSSFIRGLGV